MASNGYPERNPAPTTSEATDAYVYRALLEAYWLEVLLRQSAERENK